MAGHQDSPRPTTTVGGSVAALRAPRRPGTAAALLSAGSDQRSDGARRAPHDTRLGQLQRGRGAGFLAALADRGAARDEVLRCVLADPRVDALLETRGAYYADLATRLRVDVEPIVRAARDDEESLAVDVLAELAARGQPAATRLLVEPEREPEAAAAVLSILVQHDEWATQNLRLPAAAFLAERLAARGELEHEVEMHGEFWTRWRQSIECVERAFVDAAARAASEAALAPGPLEDLGRLATEELLARAGRGACDRQRARALLESRDSASERALLAGLVGTSHEAPLLALAADTLGSWGDLRLLASAETTFARTDLDFSGVANAVERQRRSALLQYVHALPVATTLPLARAWWPRGGFLRVAAGVLLRRRAEACDRGWLEDHVLRMAGPGSQDTLAEIEALVHIGDARSLPALIAVAERATHSYARLNALRGIAAHARDARAQDALHEALWDCEDEAVELACKRAELREARTRARIAELVAAPLACESVQAAAVSRALAF